MAEITRQNPALDNSDAFVFNNYQMLHSEALNFPVQAGITLDTCCIGFGVALAGNINRDLWDVGVVVTARLGKVR